MRLSELVDRDDLGLVVLAGGDGLDRAVRGVYTTDLQDPGPYLSAGELVLTSAGWYRDRDTVSAGRFVGALVARDATGLVAGDVVHGEVPPPLVDACRDAGLPLLAAPRRLSYGILARQVLDELLGEGNRRLHAQLDRQRRLVSATGPGGVGGLLTAVRRETGRDAALVSPTGRPVAGDIGIGRADLRALVERAPAQPGAARAGPAGRHVAFPVVGPAGHYGSLLVEGTLDDADADVTALLDSAAALLAVELSRQAEAERADRYASHAPLLAALTAPETLTAEQRASLAPVGDHRPGLVLSARIDGHCAPDIADELLDGVALGGVRVAARDDEVLAAAAPEDPTEAEALVAANAARLDGLLDDGVTVTVGVDGTGGEPARLLERARFCRTLAAHQAGRVRLARAGGLTSHLFLVSAATEDMREAFRRGLLDPLRSYDARHGSDLVGTLREFLDCDCSWQRAARRLRIHVNTLHYRIGRVATLTGRDPASLPDRVDLYLALRV